MKLGKDQENAIKELTDFFTNKETAITLSGAAGTGKTFLMSYLVDNVLGPIFNENVLFCAPTHKARLVLKRYTKTDTITIHNLLGLRPDLDILKLDMKNLMFKTFDDKYSIIHGLVVCDEASMINDDIYDKLVELCAKNDNKILFIGDKAQLQPVKEFKISKVFKSSKIVELNEIFRQSSEHGAINILKDLRIKPINNIQTSMGSEGSIIKLDPVGFLTKAVKTYRDNLAGDTKIDYTKILVWTNNMVSAYNEFIRKSLFKDNYKTQFQEHEIITMYSNSNRLINSMDYVILSSIKGVVTIDNLSFKVYHLVLYDQIDRTSYKADVLDNDTDKKILIEYVKKLEYLRLKAIKDRSYWKKYYQYYNLFLNISNFKVKTRTIKPKQIDYGYACTIHKSQGSTYNDVFVDLQDVFKNHNISELRQLEYVAISRAKNNIFIFEQ